MSDDPDTLISLWGGSYVACIIMPQNSAQWYTRSIQKLQNSNSSSAEVVGVQWPISNSLVFPWRILTMIHWKSTAPRLFASSSCAN